VTAASWPDLLVNEGLATLAEYGCLAAVLPRQVGRLGAAVLMRGMAGGPPGVNPGVHEGKGGGG
jgi:aminopeptidase N